MLRPVYIPERSGACVRGSSVWIPATDNARQGMGVPVTKKRSEAFHVKK
jgi:hypothetical protein